MKTVHRTYRFRLDPNKEQRELLARHFGSVRYVYNHFLAERMRQYEETGRSDNYYAQAAALTRLKADEGHLWLKEINAQSLQHALRHLDTAYGNFFRHKARFPRFKSKKARNSFTIPQHVEIRDGHLYFPKFKDGIRVRIHRTIEGTIKSATVTLSPAGKYHVCLLTEQLYEPLPLTGRQAGVDLGLKTLAATSDGDTYANNRYLKRYLRRLATAQKHLSRKKKGSNGYERQRLRVARLHEKVSNTRNDRLHKVALDLVRRYDVICLEDLNAKGMMRNHRLSRSIADAGWGTLVAYICYKAEMNGRTVSFVDRVYPSSQTCGACGYVNKAVKDLKIREWDCPSCGTHHDRDLNAARNILAEGIRILSAGTADHTAGGDVRPSSGGCRR